jgi:CRISPR/Cas system-associated exonuclease Cas4 (RecB family)
MKAFLISPSHPLIEEIVSHLSGVDKDYSSSLVVFPGKRPSHFLRKTLAEKEGSSFLPPRIFSMDEFVDHIDGEMLGHRTRKLEPIDAVAILYEIHRTSPDPLGKKSFLDPDTFFPIGLKIYSDLEDLCIEGVSSRRVREIDSMAGEKIPEPSARRLQSLSHFYEAFYQKIDEAHTSTRSSRYRDVSSAMAKVNLDAFRKMIFAGFFGLTRSEKEIFRSLRSREETLFLFQEGFGLDLSELGITPERKGAPGKPVIHFYKSPDTHGQVFGVGSLLKEKVEKGEQTDEKTVVVLPTPETLFPLFHHSLNLFKPDEYNISLGYPLQRTPLFGLFNNLMELVVTMDGDRLYVPYYLEFILHPYVKNLYFDGRADLTRILFHTMEEALTERRSKKFMSLSEIETDETIMSFIKDRVLDVEPDLTLKGIMDHLKAIHANTLGKMLSCRDVGDFARKLKEVVEYIYGKSTARLHPFFYPYSESLVSQLDLVSRSLMKEVKFEEIGSYFNLIKRVMMTAYTPFVGTPLRGVQVLGFLETRNIRFEKVFFLDVNEGIVPEMTKEDSLLPFKVRQILGLPTYLDRERLMAYYFDTLIKGAREVHLFYVENDEKDRSRFIEKLLWERQREERKSDDENDVSLSTLRPEGQGTLEVHPEPHSPVLPSKARLLPPERVKAIQYAVTLRGQRPHPITKSDEIVRFLKDYRFSASSLDRYLRCPLQFYYEYVLGLREREIVSDELEREEIGLFVHQVLFDYFKGRTGRPLSEKDMNPKELEKIIHVRFEERYGKDPAGEIYLLRRQIGSHLKDFLMNYQTPKLREFPTEIVALEHRLEVVKESFRLTARLDRVEKRGGKTAILDYKTSASKKYLSVQFKKLDPGNRETWSEAIGTLQLPVYLMVYSEAAGEKPEEIDCLFLLLGRNIIDPAIELPLFKDETEFKENFRNLTEIIVKLLKEIVDPELPFLPTIDPKNRCAGCLYAHICTNPMKND